MRVRPLIHRQDALTSLRSTGPWDAPAREDKNLSRGRPEERE